MGEAEVVELRERLTVTSEQAWAAEAEVMSERGRCEVEVVDLRDQLTTSSERARIAEQKCSELQIQLSSALDRTSVLQYKDGSHSMGNPHTFTEALSCRVPKVCVLLIWSIRTRLERSYSCL